MARRILIVGTGLIGASIGLALRAAGFDGEIVGTGPTEATLTTASEMGAIDTWLGREDAAGCGRGVATSSCWPDRCCRSSTGCSGWLRCWASINW